MADTEVFPSLGGRGILPTREGNVVGAAAVSSQNPQSSSNSSSYNSTIGSVIDAIRTTGGVVGGLSSAGSFAMQQEYARTAAANQNAINSNINAVNGSVGRLNTTVAIGDVLSGYASAGAGFANNLSVLNNQKNALVEANGRLAAISAAANADRLSRDKAVRAAANETLKSNYAAMQNNNALLTQIASEANKNIAGAIANQTAMESYAGRVGVDPANMQSSINNRLQSESNALAGNIARLNQSGKDAQNDQQAYINRQAIATYGQQSSSALNYIANGVGDLAAGNPAQFGGNLVAGGLAYTSQFAPNLVPAQALMQASANIIAAGLENGNISDAFNKAATMIGQAKYWDNTSVAIMNFDKAAAAGDMVGMAVTATSSFGNTMQALGNMTQALAGGFDPISTAIGGAASMAGIGMNLGAVGLANLATNAGANEIMQVGAFNTVNSLSQLPVVGGLFDFGAAFGMSASNLFEGTLGNPNNPNWRQGWTEVLQKVAQESGNVVRLDAGAAYSAGVPGFAMLVNNPQLGISGMMALRAIDPTPTSNISASPFSNFPSLNLPMGGTGIPPGIGSFDWGPSQGPTTPAIGSWGATNMVSNFLGGSTGGGGFGGDGGFGGGGLGGGGNTGGGGFGGGTAGYPGGTSGGPGGTGPGGMNITIGGGGYDGGGPGNNPYRPPSTDLSFEDQPKPPKPAPTDPFELPSTGVRGEDEPTTKLPEEPPTDVLGVPEEPPTMVSIAEEPPTTNNPEEVPDSGDSTGEPPKPPPPPTPPAPTPPTPPLPPKPPTKEERDRERFENGEMSAYEAGLYATKYGI